MDENSLAMNGENTPYNPSIRTAARAAKRERAFDLSLPASVKGQDARGKRFEEQTAICSISAQEVSFRLSTRLLVGAKMAVNLEIPRTLILESPLRLLVTGSVVQVQSEAHNGKSQFVTVRLDRSFRLRPNPLSSS